MNFVTDMRSLAIATLTLGAVALPSHGQLLYAENFQTIGSPDDLRAAGWILSDQSIDPHPYRTGWKLDPIGGPAGTLHLRGTTEGAYGEISNWAVLPQIEGIAPGTRMFFWTTGFYFGDPRYDWMELRYSPTGGVSTGAGVKDVGDFTELVWSQTPAEGGMWWSTREITLPGPGRYALRYRRDGDTSVYGHIGIDGIEIGESAVIPLPAPGQTVQWTLAMSPIRIEGNTTIPAGGTVRVEPGVAIEFSSDKKLFVNGRLESVPGGPEMITLTGDTLTVRSGLSVGATGEVDLHFAEIDCAVMMQNGAYVGLTDSVVRPTGGEFNGGRTSVTRFTRTTIEKDWFEPWGNIVLEDATFTGTRFYLQNYAVHNGLTLSGGGRVEQIVSYQDVWMKDLNISGAAESGIWLNPGSWGAGDALITGESVISDNGYPVKLNGAGLHPDSELPLTGNDNNAILLTNGGGGLRYNRNTWPDLGLDYHLLELAHIQGEVEMAPGLRFKGGPEGRFGFFASQNDYRVRGTPDAPLIFEPLAPGGQWLGIGIEKGLNNLFEHIHVSGADRGIAAFDGIMRVNESTFEGNNIGIRPSLANFFVMGSQFLGNTIGAEEDPSITFEGLDLDMDARPNIFEGNTLAVKEDIAGGGVIDAEHNWWGASDGPGGFYGGSGDPVDGKADPLPFLTMRPDLSDTPPVVRAITRPYLYGRPGDALILEWSASDDDRIVSQRVLAYNGLAETIVLADDLPGEQRRVEITIPPRLIHLRIEATDSAGQSSYEQLNMRSPVEMPSADVAFHNDFSAGVTGGQEETICYDATGVSRGVHIYLELGAEERWVRGPGGWPGTGECSFSTLRFPYISTDRARIAIDGSKENNWEWYFSEPFEIRPDPRIGDAPPTVAMLTPADGASFAGGSVVPISWTASDDEGVREFRIQYSTNGGYTWHTLRHRLPGELRSYDWRLPQSEGIEDLRVRVVASDLRFQSSTDGDDHVLSVTPGCRADLDGNGAIDFFDFLAFQSLFAAGDLTVDFTGDGMLDFFDFLAFQSEYAAGCD